MYALFAIILSLYRGVTFAINKFADMTSEEFKSTILMPDTPTIPLAEKR